MPPILSFQRRWRTEGDSRESSGLNMDIKMLHEGVMEPLVSAQCLWKERLVEWQSCTASREV